MPAHDITPRQWLLAAAGVAVLHSSVLYALWGPADISDLGLPAGQPLAAEGRVIPVTPVSTAPPPRRMAPPPPTVVAAAPTEVSNAITPTAQTEPPPAAETDPLTPHVDQPANAEPATETLAKADPEVPTPVALPEPAMAHKTALATPPSAQWHYEVRGESKGLNYTAHATLDWRQDGQHYEARLEVSAFLVGSRVQTSSGTLGPAGLQPARFSDRARKERRLLFDHDAHLIRLEGSDATAPLSQGVQDRLSLFLQLSSMLATLPRPPEPGAQWSVAVAGSPAADTWTFHYLQTESLQLPAGRYEAWHLRRAPRNEGDQQVDLWFAPALHHLPVRIRIQQGNGDVIDQQLSPG